MASIFIPVKKVAILCHRWMGVAFCLLFAWWFLSGIFMMYWDYPGISAADRLERAEPIDASKVRLSPAEAWAKSGQSGAAAGLMLDTLDGRPVYRFRRSGEGTPVIVHADDGTVQKAYSDDLLGRMVALWTGQPPSSGRVEEVTKPDQWTIQIRNRLPLTKYSFPDGQQVYVAKNTGEILQYTTTVSRIGAHLGPIPHCIYYTPLRVKQKLWSNIVIYASGLATCAALLGLTAGLWMYSPSKKYRFEGEPASVPYSGQKRLHMILGLFFGLIACTWAFSGMLSMDPPFLTPRVNREDRGESAAARIQASLRPVDLHLAAYDANPPARALSALGTGLVKQLDFSSFDGEPVYLATLGTKKTLIIPLHGEVQPFLDINRILNLVVSAARPTTVAESRLLTKYDAYYIDRHHRLPLPVISVRLSDDMHTQLYIDPGSGQVMRQHSDASSFINRWLYHGLHSMDFPWLYNHRPAWDIVVLILMIGGLWLCVTSVIIAWQVVRRKFAGGAALRA